MPYDGPQIVTTPALARQVVRAWQAEGKRVGLVPTMGALHAGHLSLVEAARRECDVVAVTIFVNPTQFGPHEDFSKYPRTLERDLELLKPLGVELLFAPNTADMYPAGHATSVVVTGVAEPLEGGARPGHFSGVATVVLKLFNCLPADAAFFGQKDYQQTMVVRRMVEDLDVPIAVRVCPTMREADGLAMSSRNVYLSPDERQRALSLSRGLRRVEALVARGERDVPTLEQAMHTELSAAGVRIEYARVVDAETLATIDKLCQPAVALVAARVGTTRLIDNAVLDL